MNPRPYQLAGRDFLAGRKRALLADQMRVGKTPQAILAADAVGAKRVLVLCPAIGRYQWREEWAAWSPNRPVAAILEREPPPARFEGVLIASYNRAVQHQDALCEGQTWDVFIPDEAHFAKNPEAQRTRVVYGKDGIGWHADRIWALTGTPAPNHAGEMWPMLRAYGVVKCGYEDFVRYFCYYDERERRVFGNKRAHLDELRALFAPIVLRRMRKDVAPDMPEISYNFLSVEPYANVDLPSEDLDQIDAEDRIAVAHAKVPQLALEIDECIRGQEYQQTVVFGYHVEPLHALGELLTAADLDVSIIYGGTPDAQRQRIIAAHKAGVCQVVIAQIMAGGMAIDLSAASHGYFLELDYVPGNNAQAASRLVNLQLQEPVTMDVVTWPGSMDDKVQRTLLRKTQAAVFA